MGNVNLDALAFYDLEKAGARIKEILDKSVTSVEPKSEDGEIPVFSGASGRVIKKSGTNIERIFGDKEVIIGLNEPVPDNAISSICDFKLVPTTMQAAYGLCNTIFMNSTGKFRGFEVPLLTTQGTLAINDKDGNIRYSKYINPLINYRNVSDELTQNGVSKVWSEKFYLNKSPVTSVKADDFDSTRNIIHTWEFTKEDFVNTGLPAKLPDIPMASPCFYNAENSQNFISGRVYFAQPYPAKFSYNSETGKYILTARGVYNEIEEQLTTYSKVYFYYQLEKPYIDSDFFAMGLCNGDTITFKSDFSESQKFIDNGGVYGSGASGNAINSYDITPTISVSVPLSFRSATDGIVNVANMFNNIGIGGEYVSNYEWIGDGDGTTDYTTIIQNKIDEIHKIDGKGTVYLGKGTYPITNSLILYENVSLQGVSARETVIEQRADNTHAIILSGKNISVMDLFIKLSGACTELTGCIYANSYNVEENPSGYNPDYPKNFYCQHINIVNVNFEGNYYFDKDENGYSYLGETYETYKGCGILGYYLYFNYVNVDNCRGRHLYAVTHAKMSSAVLKVVCEYCRYGVYDYHGGMLMCDIMGHSYYTSKTVDGSTISASDSTAYVMGSMSTYNILTFDEQWYRDVIYFAGTSQQNTYTLTHDINNFGNNMNMATSKETLDATCRESFVTDFGRGNQRMATQYQQLPYQVGGRRFDLSGQTSMIGTDLVINNAISGAGIWGNITTNIEWDEKKLPLSDVCRYPKRMQTSVMGVSSVVSKVSPSTDSPVELFIDFSNRPFYGSPNFIIQFDHKYVAQEFTVYFDYEDDGTYEDVFYTRNNTDVTVVYNRHQHNSIMKNMKIVITKALQIKDFLYKDSGYTEHTIDYNPNGLIGIVNIGAVADEYCGTSFLGECGGSLYGDVDLHGNTLKNVAEPKEDCDVATKSYTDEAVRAQVQGLKDGVEKNAEDVAEVEKAVELQNELLFDGGNSYEPAEVEEKRGMTVSGTTAEQWVEFITTLDAPYFVRGVISPSTSYVRLPVCSASLKVFNESLTTSWSKGAAQHTYHIAKYDVSAYVGQTIKVYGRSRTASSYPLAFIVDENGNVLGRYGTDDDTLYGYTSATGLSAAKEAVEVTVPDGAKYIYVIGAYVNNAYDAVPKIEVPVTEYKASEMYKFMQSPLWGKKLYVDGDSICYGNGYKGGFGKIIADRYNMELVNNAVGGATLASGTMDEKKLATYGNMDWTKSYFLRLSNYNPVTEAYEGTFSIPMTEELYNNGYGVAPTWYKLIDGVMVEQPERDDIPTDKWYLKFDVPTYDGNTTEKWLAMWAYPNTDGSYNTSETTGSRWLWEAYKSGFATAHQNKYCTIGEVRHCISTTVEEVDTTADYVIFEGGLNDYLMNKGIGTLTQDMTSPVDIQTMVGGLERICRYLLTNCAGKKVLFVITPKTKNHAYSINNDGSSWTKATLTDYHDAIVAVLKKYSIPYVDLFETSAFCTEIETHLQYTKNNDGVHPTQEGYELFYVPQIVSKAESI